MTKKVYVGNLPFQTKEEEVRELFAPYGDVQSVAMITDRDTGRFRGFCFVEMDDGAARTAIDGLNGEEVGGRKIRVSEARSRKKQAGGEKRRPALHERTSRGTYGSQGNRFPHSGGGKGSSRRRERQSNSDFPHSGGGSRRNS